MGAVVARTGAVERGARRVRRPVPAVPEVPVKAWEALLHPALLPTVFVPSGEAAPKDDEDVAVRKV